MPELVNVEGPLNRQGAGDRMIPALSRQPAGRTGPAAIKPLVLLVVCAALGWGIARSAHVSQLYSTPGYLTAVTAVLAVGLYGATSGIDRTELRGNWRTVLLALTVGVLAKAALIALVMAAFRPDPRYDVVLGVAVAQIDPVSVAAMVGASRMTDSAKTVLRAWASFDDPVTLLVTVYLLASALPAGAGGLTGGPVLGPVLNLLGNAAFAGLVWLLQRGIARWTAGPSVPVAVRRWLEVGLLLAAGVLAVWFGGLLGLAVIGLFLRPGLTGALDRVNRWLLVAAAIALGLGLSGGVDWGTGAALGGAAFLAQVVVAPVVARGLPGTDRVYLALGQQNGITAITLALLVEAVYPGTVAVVAPAVLVINTLNLVTGAVWDHHLDTHERTRPRTLTPRPTPRPKPRPAHTDAA
jgi:NhaP-type Na+/H+ or K+/H+ antiporter